MSAIVINHDGSKFELKFKRAALWFSRIEFSIYVILFMLVFGAVYLDHDTRLWIKIAVMTILVLVFILLLLKNINIWKGYKFNLEKIGNDFFINEKVKVANIPMSNISLKKRFSVVSVNTNFDIYLWIDGRKLLVIKGVSGKDKEIIMKELGIFLSCAS